MGFLEKLIGGASAQPIEAVFKGIDSLVTNDEERVAADLLKLKAMQEPHKMQVELNKMEAGHRSLFVAGWRPAIGWICALSLAFTFIANPAIQWISGDPGPDLHSDFLNTLVISLLGLGGLRTIEKIKGRAK